MPDRHFPPIASAWHNPTALTQISHYQVRLRKRYQRGDVETLELAV
jgi:hypothetical protein